MQPQSPAKKPPTSPANVASQTVQIQTQGYVGPIPPPELLQGFENVQAGFADRIVRMAEKEQATAHQIQRRNFWGPFMVELIGMLMAFAIVIAGLWAGYSLLQQGRDIGGYAAWAVALGTLAATAVYRRKKTDA
jgi:uncharacterized membrane protein